VIVEFSDKEVMICISCNVAFRYTGIFLPMKYKYCPYCQKELRKISELIDNKVVETKK